LSNRLRARALGSSRSGANQPIPCRSGDRRRGGAADQRWTTRRPRRPIPCSQVEPTSVIQERGRGLGAAARRSTGGDRVAEAGPVSSGRGRGLSDPGDGASVIQGRDPGSRSGGRVPGRSGAEWRPRRDRGPSGGRWPEWPRRRPELAGGEGEAAVAAGRGSRKPGWAAAAAARRGANLSL
jgi:hypothetical protein